MNAPEICSLIREGKLPELSESDIREENGYLIIKDKIPLPVVRDCSWSKGSDYEIQDESGAIIGVLSNTLGIDTVDVRLLSEWQLAAYLLERELNEFDQPGKFQHDYAVISSLHFSNYQLSMRRTSAIWGMFSHIDCTPVPRLTRRLSLITAVGGMQVPTSFHAASLERAVHASHPFERYLKYYHELELLFDWIIVKKIQALGSDIQGIAKLISSYQSGDLPRLKSLITTYSSDSQQIHSLLALAVAHRSTAFKIFQDYSKDGNPLSIEHKWDKMFENLSSSYSPSHASSNGLGKTRVLYDNLILETAAYWVFRVRCCIAHHRIGEYLLTQLDEEYVVEFAEPLLLGILRSILSNSDFLSII
jgi:hypothetical protein